MAIITLTSDLGLSDHYVAAIKGKLLSGMPNCNITDISHQVPSHGYIQAAHILKNSFYHFPTGTIHVISVTSDSNIRYVAVEYKGHYFLGPDNGFFAVLIDSPITKAVELPPAREKVSFAAFDTLCNAAIKLAGSSIETLGTRIEKLSERHIQQPYLNGTALIGQIVYIDKFENAITNISKELFEKNRNGKKFLIDIRGYEIEKIESNYDQVANGELLAFFNSSGVLEIAINQGQAKSLLYLKSGDNIAINFDDN